MLKIISNLSELNIGQLKALYEESIQKHGLAAYAPMYENMRIINAEQDFYADLQAFLNMNGAEYALWVSEERYVSAIRLEPIPDGCLLTSLETLPAARGNGFGKMLMKAVAEYILQTKKCCIYSHVDESNLPSLNIHLHCGFHRTDEPAVFVDGSLHHDYTTYVLVK